MLVLAQVFVVAMTVATVLPVPHTVPTGTVPILPPDCSCAYSGDLPISGEGPCGLEWELTQTIAVVSKPCETGCVSGTASGCEFRPVARIWAGPIADCPTLAAVVEWHTTNMVYSVNCQGQLEGPPSTQTSESQPAQDPGGVAHRFGLIESPCGKAFAYSMKVWYECPCPGGGSVQVFETPLRTMKCNACCP